MVVFASMVANSMNQPFRRKDGDRVRPTKGGENMFRILIGTILMVFLIVVIGSLLLEQFPSLIPLWEELKMHVVNLYESSLVKYGTITTLILIVAIFIMVGSSKKF